ncbi:MAG: DUF2706 domain-containing protein [Alphaproteobacteria bacterium]|nr:DUF2706 domain-containing protein [Alphaproteobacteria bacterium]
MTERDQEKVFGTCLKAVSKVLLIAFCLSNILSCSSSTLYETKSPCVSIDNGDPYFRAPCSKRSVNIEWDIG